MIDKIKLQVEKTTQVEPGIELEISVVPVRSNTWKIIYDTVNQNQIRNQFHQMVTHSDVLRFDSCLKVF